MAPLMSYRQHIRIGVFVYANNFQVDISRLANENWSLSDALLFFIRHTGSG